MAVPNDNLFIGDLPPDINDEMISNIFGAYGTVVSCRAMPARSGVLKGAALVKFGSLNEATWVLENLNGNIPEGLEGPVVIHYARNQPGAASKGTAVGPPSNGYGKGPPQGQGMSGWEQRSAPYPQGKGGGNGGCSWGGKGGGKGGCSWGGGGCGGGSDFRSMYKGLAKGGVFPGMGVRPDDQCVYVKNLPADTTDMNLYELFSPFGAIAPHGVRAMLKEDGTCNSVGFVDFQDPSSALYAIQSLQGTQVGEHTLHLNLKRPRKGGAGKGAPEPSTDNSELFGAASGGADDGSQFFGGSSTGREW